MGRVIFPLVAYFLHSAGPLLHQAGRLLTRILCGLSLCLHQLPSCTAPTNNPTSQDGVLFEGHRLAVVFLEVSRLIQLHFNFTWSVLGRGGVVFMVKGQNSREDAAKLREYLQSFWLGVTFPT